jgi:hypothetical protein
MQIQTAVTQVTPTNAQVYDYVRYHLHSCYMFRRYYVASSGR